jgi:hypothetical protein
MKLNIQITTVLAIAFFVFFGIFESQAQVSFKPGFRAGANFAHFTKGNDYYYDPYNPSNSGNDYIDYTTKTEFYIGFYGALKLSKYYTLQPEIDYSAQGSNYKTVNNRTANLNIDYLSFELLNKFTFDKLNIHFGPTLDFVVDKNFDADAEVDMAFVLGMGVNFTPNFGIEARVKKGIIPVVDYESSHTNVVFSIGGTYTFDVK